MNKSFRSLENYKRQQENVAKAKGIYEELLKCKTLTKAREVVYGRKDKIISGWRGHLDWINSMKNKQHNRNF